MTNTDLGAVMSPIEYWQLRMLEQPSVASAVGQPREKIRIEPIDVPVPSKEPVPAVETPSEVPEKVPA